MLFFLLVCLTCVSLESRADFYPGAEIQEIDHDTLIPVSVPVVGAPPTVSSTEQSCLLPSSITGPRQIVSHTDSGCSAEDREKVKAMYRGILDKYQVDCNKVQSTNFTDKECKDILNELCKPFAS